ncbi:MAG: hypothetical protein K8S13_24670 [Desulfobacula sp.]|uniref:hypothetical protein n=1 Tax=Desulfobacula sp. TaxID=2593537 RepID=UPI0025BE70B1|nr:hypothetical protein [Desulfobacula sp.]MCD4723024.1 hypothetical protein [Desulfobacula sp.]
MKEWLKRVILLTAVLTLSTIGTSVLLPVSVEAFSATEEVVMSFPDGDDLVFTITNDYTDIVEFAIGNPDALWAWVNPTEFAPASLVYGAVAYKDFNGDWTTWVEGYDENNTSYYRDLDWMEAPNSGFADYSQAFLFTSWGAAAAGDGFEYTGVLETGFTDGYAGISGLGPQSPVAAYSLSQGTINGGEAQVVPVPGAIWLLGSGLLGFIGLHHKKNGSAD